MSFVIYNVTDGQTTNMPRWPTRVTFKIQADVKETRFPGALPLLLAFGKKANKLQIEGVIQIAGVTKPTLVTSYLLPLETAVYKEVTITASGMIWASAATSPARRYTFAGITFEERPGITRAFFYTAEFWQGSDIIQM